MATGLVKSYRELEVYQAAFRAAMEIFEASKKFPVEERYSLTDQIRRSSETVNYFV
ncbi:four helix bundle protein [Leptolyngbya sp. O-77]|uniref:four helix bundle protein n=1 Tax=Leptolyngbya sp. O-77 TaxID=1080068 RepID=UPI000A0136DD|nr:four helix bundle protein [Leptolyngbya sp. O-77]